MIGSLLGAIALATAARKRGAMASLFTKLK